MSDRLSASITLIFRSVFYNMQNQTVEKASVPILTLAALGVVFGDIGTSPFMHLKKAFMQHMECQSMKLIF